MGFFLRFVLPQNNGNANIFLHSFEHYYEDSIEILIKLDDDDYGYKNNQS